MVITQDKMESQYILVQDKIRESCEKSGRNPDEIHLLWVSKTQPPHALINALKLGAVHLGENKVQEVLDKFPLDTDLKYILHFIGHLQSNKVRKILPLAEYIHSVDSLKLLNKIETICGELNLKRKVFLQVNTSGEENKSGFHPETFLEELKSIPDLNHVTIIGLMTIGTLSKDLKEADRCFRNLSQLLHQVQGLAQEKPALSSINSLSMGMSGDFDVAIGLGSHYIRIGTKLFGTRNY